MTHAYDASHVKNSGSGVEDSGAPDPPKAPPIKLCDRLTAEIDEGRVTITDIDGDFVVFDSDAFQRLLAYVEKWK